MPFCILKKGKETPIREFHPWVYSGAVERTQAEAGDVVQVLDYRGRFIAQGHWSPHSPIAIRVLTWNREKVDRAFFERRLKRALELRKPLGQRTNAVRLVNAEGDLLPGLIVDRYGPLLAIQVHTWGMERVKEEILSCLEALIAPKAIYEKSDPQARQREGLKPQEGLLKGNHEGLQEVEEFPFRFLIDIQGGQKTGFYLDQRDNRQLILHLAEGKKVLDCFCYTGGFTVAALKGGAKFVRAVDSSASALSLAKENVLLNGLDLSRCDFHRADAFEFLREERERYDLVILDPPPFARSRDEVPQALRGYEEINYLAMRLLKKGGLLLSCCCTQRVSLEDLSQAIYKASLRLGRAIQLLSSSRAPLDHPVLFSHPEGDYFKALLIRIL